MIITVDGPAAAGKGTIGRRLAQKFDLAFLDTGGLYRAVALSMLRGGQDPSDEAAATAAAENLDAALLDDPELRGEKTGAAASVVAAQPGVRAALLAYQRSFAANPPGGKRGVLLDGRDCGTVICPLADIKFFVTASAEERARRRHKEMQDRGDEVDFDAILADVKARDARDSSRAEAPMVAAQDAYLLDTTLLDIEAAVDRAAAYVRQHLPVQ